MISQNNFKDDIKQILLRIEKLPLIENYSKFKIELEGCKESVNNCVEIL